MKTDVSRYKPLAAPEIIPRPGRRPDGRGFTLLELVITMAIVAVLAAAALPMSENAVKRRQELELREALRNIRSAIDDWKDDFDQAVAAKKIIPSINDTGYPENLEQLTEGNDWNGLYPYKRKYLRRIPVDPFDRDQLGWGLRSYQDPPDSAFYSGDDVYDVYSLSEATALDGTLYSSW